MWRYCQGNQGSAYRTYAFAKRFTENQEGGLGMELPFGRHQSGPAVGWGCHVGHIFSTGTSIIFPS